MKIKNLMLFMLSVTYYNANAQLNTGFHYNVKQSEFSVVYYTSDDRKYEVIKSICSRKLKASIEQDSTDSVLKIDFWAITGKDPCQGDSNKINQNDKLGTGCYYYLKFKQRTNMNIPIQYIQIPHVAWTLGAISIPFKFRLGSSGIPNDVSTNINLGIYIGRQWGKTRFYENAKKTTDSWSFTLAGFFTPTAITINSDNTSNQVQTTTNELALSYGAAAILAYQDINIGLLLGVDSPVSGKSSKWIYANRPWIGLGIGYKLGILGASKS